MPKALPPWHYIGAPTVRQASAAPRPPGCCPVPLPDPEPHCSPPWLTQCCGAGARAAPQAHPGWGQSLDRKGGGCRTRGAGIRAGQGWTEQDAAKAGAGQGWLHSKHVALRGGQGPRPAHQTGRLQSSHSDPSLGPGTGSAHISHQRCWSPGKGLSSASCPTYDARPKHSVPR